MTEISVANVNVEDFNLQAGKMLPSTDKKIFFEGKTNKKYYQKIELFRKYTLDTGGPSSNIKKIVSQNSKFYGVIDGDFFNENLDRIYQIDFYSIENIVLSYHGILGFHLLSLVELLKDYFKSEQKIRHRLILTKDSHQCFAIEKELKIDSQFYDYIDEKIIDEETFLKYMDLKKIVGSYMVILKQNDEISKECRKAAKDYIPTCNEIKINELFSVSEVERIRREL
ncbi:MAG: hypothetical protein E6Z94_01640 [Streptococcus salivarius]|nr:hypothetical protein [Streptococcus salivarius]